MIVVQENQQLFLQMALALMCGGVLALVPRPARWLPFATVIVSVATYGVALPAVAAVTALVFGAARLVRATATGEARPAPRRWRLAVLAIALLGAAFVVLRMSSSGSLRHGLLFPWEVSVIDMWLALRLATFLYDTGSGRVRNLSAGAFFQWAFLPFQAFGPLMRFPAYMAQQPGGGKPVTTVPLETSFRTALLGVAQIAAAIAIGGGQAFLSRSAPHVVAQGAALAFSAPWSFYLLTAGYFKMMELAARSCGLTLPPSFNNPFAKRNLSAFWASWNMSATAAFRDTLFYQRWTKPSVDLYINTCIIFVLVGAWHGANAYWLIWGTLHAIGFCTYLAVSRRWPAGATTGRAGALAAWAATYLFVVSCWAAPPQIMKLGARLF